MKASPLSLPMFFFCLSSCSDGGSGGVTKRSTPSAGAEHAEAASCFRFGSCFRRCVCFVMSIVYARCSFLPFASFLCVQQSTRPSTTTTTAPLLARHAVDECSIRDYTMTRALFPRMTNALYYSDHFLADARPSFFPV